MNKQKGTFIPRSHEMSTQRFTNEHIELSMLLSRIWDNRNSLSKDDLEKIEVLATKSFTYETK